MSKHVNVLPREIREAWKELRKLRRRAGDLTSAERGRLEELRKRLDELDPEIRRRLSRSPEGDVKGPRQVFDLGDDDSD